MRIKIKHETFYDYEKPVHSAVQLLRLTPRSSETQFVRFWRVAVDADARLERDEDAFGNLTHLVFIDGPIEALRISVEGEVETMDHAGVVKGSVERQSERLFLRDTALTRCDSKILAFARDALSAEGGDLLAGLHRMNRELNQTMDFQIGATTAATTAAEAFERRTGVCQDFAHILIASARALGIPARYANGYLMRTDRIDQDAGHAWVEAYLPDLGWVAFDPAQGVSATDRHVRVAIGADSNDAAPIRGARSGGIRERLRVAIEVAPGRKVLEMSAHHMPGGNQQQ